MNNKLLFRLDDITPGLNGGNFKRIENIFDEFGVKPLIGVVPFNEDEHLMVEEPQADFWNHLVKLQQKGWTIALHGYKHVYINEESGILKANPFSEFAGVDYETQSKMIAEGKSLLESRGLEVDYFMAPGHTFDENTLKALVANGINKLTDGYTSEPYIRDGVTFVPCKLTDAVVPNGVDTVCIHLNNWGENDFASLESFLKSNSSCVTGFEGIEKEVTAIPYDGSIARQEERFLKIRAGKQKAAESEVMQYYLRKSYSDNKYIKLIKRVIMLPLLLRSKGAVANLIRTVLFGAIFLWLLMGVSYVLRTNGDTKDRMAGFYAEKRDSIDVLMFGASTVGTSFSAPYMWGEYGFTSYPLSGNSQRTTAIKYLIEEGLKYQNPDMIVIEMRTFFGDDEEMARDEGHIRETTDNMRYSINRIKTINAVADHYDDKWPFYFDIMKYHTNIGMLKMPSEWKKFTFSTKDENKGFVISDEVKSYWKKGYEVDLDKVSRQPLSAKQEEVLEDLLSYLKDNDIEALFVVTPRDSQDGYNAVMNYAGDIVKAAGFDYIDMNYCYDEMDFHYSSDMKDGAHTNVWGAVKCSDLLGQYISDNYELRQEHNKKVEEEWNEAYTEFMKKYNDAVPVETD